MEAFGAGAGRLIPLASVGAAAVVVESFPVVSPPPPPSMTVRTRVPIGDWMVDLVVVVVVDETTDEEGDEVTTEFVCWTNRTGWADDVVT